MRQELETHFKRSLKPYKSYIDEQMIIAFGQMDPPSLILDWMYLGNGCCAMLCMGLRNVSIATNP